jgi:serine/threonine protein kinase
VTGADLLAELQSSLGAAYAFDRELGGGGMARVFLAHERGLGRPVVIKILNPELAEGINAERFEREIKLAASLQQANIVPLLSAGRAARYAYYTMPFVEGRSLRDRLPATASCQSVRAWASFAMSPERSPTRMSEASSIATSNREMFSFRAARRSSPISGSRRRSPQHVGTAGSKR